jgi:hypothetical protein
MARLISLPPGSPVTSLALAPKTLRRISANWSGSAPVALPPMVNSRANISSQVFTFEVCQVPQTLLSLVIVPIQENLVASKGALFSSGSVIMPRLTLPICVPSFGAML